MIKRNQLVHDRLKEPYSRVLVPAEDGTYCAEILEFPGCYAEGETPEEAIRNLESVATSWIEAALEQGQNIPEPFANHGYSGKINLRLPRSIHKKAARFAQKEDVSLNQFFASAIAARVGAEDFYDHLVKRLEAKLTESVAVNQIRLPFQFILIRALSGVSFPSHPIQNALMELSGIGDQIKWKDSPLTAQSENLIEVSTDG